MNIRILLGLVAVGMLFQSCDEPLPTTDSNFVYNPFVFNQDTLNTVNSITIGEGDVLWNDHDGAWVGENTYFKAGFSVDLSFSDTLYDALVIDSVLFEMQHIYTFATNETDTMICVDLYETTGMIADLESASYGTYLGCETVAINGSNNAWTFKLPPDLIGEGDSIISLGLFPRDTTGLSMVHGGGSSLLPSIAFYTFLPDTTDSLGFKIPFVQYRSGADSVYAEVVEKSESFDRDNFHYLNQFSADSLTYSLDLSDIIPLGDTLIHIDTASFIMAVDTLNSWIKVPVAYDVNPLFLINISDQESSASVDVVMNADGSYASNQISQLVQLALDDDRSSIDLLIRPNNIGSDPGFIAISKELTESALIVYSSLAVRP